MRRGRSDQRLANAFGFFAAGAITLALLGRLRLSVAASLVALLIFVTSLALSVRSPRR